MKNKYTGLVTSEQTKEEISKRFNIKTDEINESGALVNGSDEKVEIKEPKDKHKKESCLDVLSVIGEGIYDVIASVLD